MAARRPSKNAASRSGSEVTYGEFWARYLAAHADPRTRALHYLGTGGAVATFLAFLATGDWRWLAAVPVAGYAFAWAGHVLFERNRPETLSHPFWSLYSDFRMVALFFAGRLGAERRRILDER
jgi:hypothetical protein